MLGTKDGEQYLQDKDSKLPVAIRSDIYQIMVQAHKKAAHGGRDRTWGQVKKSYSYITKELAFRFVHICPKCGDKKVDGKAFRPSARTRWASVKGADEFEPIKGEVKDDSLVQFATRPQRATRKKSYRASSATPSLDSSSSRSTSPSLGGFAAPPSTPIVEIESNRRVHNSPRFVIEHSSTLTKDQGLPREVVIGEEAMQTSRQARTPSPALDWDGHRFVNPYDIPLTPVRLDKWYEAMLARADEVFMAPVLSSNYFISDPFPSPFKTPKKIKKKPSWQFDATEELCLSPSSKRYDSRPL